MLTILDTVAATASNYRASITELPQDAQNSRKTLGEMSSRIVETAWMAVTETENQLAELTRAQVVDAGATGLLLVFDALRATIRRIARPRNPGIHPRIPRGTPTHAPRHGCCPSL